MPPSARNPRQRHLKHLSLTAGVHHHAGPYIDDSPSSSPSPRTPSDPAAVHTRRTSSISYRHSLDGYDSPRLSLPAAADMLAESGERSPVDSPLDTAPAGRSSSSLARSPLSEEVAPVTPAITQTSPHADLLTFMAMKERKCLDLREELAKHEFELEALKKRYQTLVSRSMSQATIPSPTSPLSHSTTSSTSRTFSSASHPNRRSLTSPSSTYDAATSPFLSPPDLFFDSNCLTSGSGTVSPLSSSLVLDHESAAAAVISAKKYLGGIGKGILDFLNDGSPSSLSSPNSSSPSPSTRIADRLSSLGLSSVSDNPVLGVVHEEDEEAGGVGVASVRPLETGKGQGDQSHRRPRDGSMSSSDSITSSSAESLGFGGHRHGHGARGDFGEGRHSEDGSETTTVEDHSMIHDVNPRGDKTPTPSSNPNEETALTCGPRQGGGEQVKSSVTNASTSTLSSQGADSKGLGRELLLREEERTRARHHHSHSHSVGEMSKKHDRRRSTFDLVSSTAGMWSDSLGKKLDEFTNSQAYKSSKRATLTFVEGFERTLTEVITIESSSSSSASSSSASLPRSSSLAYSQSPRQHQLQVSTITSNIFQSQSLTNPSSSLQTTTTHRRQQSVPPGQGHGQGVFTRKARERATTKLHHFARGPKSLPEPQPHAGQSSCSAEFDKKKTAIEEDTWAW